MVSYKMLAQSNSGMSSNGMADGPGAIRPPEPIWGAETIRGRRVGSTGPPLIEVSAA